MAKIIKEVYFIANKTAKRLLGSRTVLLRSFALYFGQCSIAYILYQGHKHARNSIAVSFAVQNFFQLRLSCDLCLAFARPKGISLNFVNKATQQAAKLDRTLSCSCGV